MNKFIQNFDLITVVVGLICAIFSSSRIFYLGKIKKWAKINWLEFYWLFFGIFLLQPMFTNYLKYYNNSTDEINEMNNRYLGDWIFL